MIKLLCLINIFKFEKERKKSSDNDAPLVLSLLLLLYFYIITNFNICIFPKFILNIAKSKNRNKAFLKICEVSK